MTIENDRLSDEVISLVFEAGKRLAVVAAFSVATREIAGEVWAAGVAACGYALLIWGVASKMLVISHDSRDRPVPMARRYVILGVNAILMVLGGSFLMAVLRHLAEV